MSRVYEPQKPKGFSLGLAHGVLSALDEVEKGLNRFREALKEFCSDSSVCLGTMVCGKNTEEFRRQYSSVLKAAYSEFLKRLTEQEV